MPISRDEFQAGLADLTLPILRLLEDHKEFAYTAEEINKMLMERLQKDVSLQDVVLSLEQLIKAKHVETKEIAGRNWYAIIKKGIGFH